MSDPLPTPEQAQAEAHESMFRRLLEASKSEQADKPTIVSAPSLTPEQLVFYMRGVAEATNGVCPEHVARHLLALAIRAKLPGEVKVGCGCAK